MLHLSMAPSTSGGDTHEAGKCMNTGRVGSLVRRWRELRADKRTLQAQLQAHAHLLEPGVWVLPRARLALHLRRGRPPAHLRLTTLRPKGDPSFCALTRERLKSWLAFPIVTRVPRVRATGHRGIPPGQRFPIALVPASRSMVLIDPEGGLVVRFLGDRPPRPEALRVRELMSRHVATPAIEPLPDGDGFREEFVGGRMLPDLDVDTRRDVLRHLMEGCASLCRAEATGSAAPTLARALDAARASALPSALRRHLDRESDAIRDRARGWPVAPCHGDLHHHNLVVADRKPILIDFDHAAYLTFFEDPVALMIREAYWGRPELLRSFLRGELDDVCKDLWAAAGVPYAVDERETYLFASILTHAVHLATRDGDVDTEVFARNAELAWASVRDHLPA